MQRLRIWQPLACVVVARERDDREPAAKLRTRRPDRFMKTLDAFAALDNQRPRQRCHGAEGPHDGGATANRRLSRRPRRSKEVRQVRRGQCLTQKPRGRGTQLGPLDARRKIADGSVRRECICGKVHDRRRGVVDVVATILVMVFDVVEVERHVLIVMRGIRQCAHHRSSQPVPEHGEKRNHYAHPATHARSLVSLRRTVCAAPRVFAGAWWEPRCAR